MPVALISGNNTPASNAPGGNNAVLVGATVILATIVASNYRLWGFSFEGTADGRFSLQLDGVERYAASTNFTAQSGELLLPLPDVVTGTLTLRVTNNGLATAAFTCAILGGM